MHLLRLSNDVDIIDVNLEFLFEIYFEVMAFFPHIFINQEWKESNDNVCKNEQSLMITSSLLW